MQKLHHGLWIFIVLCGIMVIVFICIGCFAPFDLIEMTEDNTQEYEATVYNVVKEGENYYVTLQEYQFTLFVDHSCLQDQEVMQALSMGDKLYFRLFQGELNMLEPYIESAQLSAISLRTDYDQIITSDSYNENTVLQANNIKVVLISLSVSFFIIALLLIVLQVINFLNGNNAIYNKIRNPRMESVPSGVLFLSGKPSLVASPVHFI